jgi:hypothetical protein
LAFVGGGVEEAQKIAQFLEDEGRPFTLEGVERALQRCALGVDTQSLAQEVIEEGVRRTLESLGGLWKMLGVSPVREVEGALRQEGSLQAVCLNWKDETRVIVRISQRNCPDFSLDYPFPEHRGSRGFLLRAWTGKVELNACSGIYASRGRVFFSAGEVEKIREALEDAKALRPLLESMKIAGLDKAIEELPSLGDGEACMAGEYLLARSGDIFALRRGAVFGDLDLDGALLTQRDVRLSFPGGVEISFKVEWYSGRASFHYLRVRWGEDEIFFGGEHRFLGDILNRDPLTPALQEKVRHEAKTVEWSREPVPDYCESCSPKMLAFLRTFAGHESPLEALARGEFDAYTTAELFSEI